MTAPLTAIELFAGGGGLALGTEEAGFQHPALIEWDRDACATLRQRPEWRGVVVEGDVRDVDFTAYRGVDLIAGGPPCQSFSTAGKRKLGAAALNMFPAAVQAIADARPRAVLLENVTGLVKGRARAYFDRVRAQIKALGYDVYWRVLNAAAHGVPQLRKRVITVAFRRDAGARWAWPAPAYPWRTVRQALAGLPPQPPPRWASAFKGEKGIMRWTELDGQAWTITTVPQTTFLREGEGADGHPRFRFLAIRELARIQTFPDHWSFAGDDASQLRQIGNAVPVKLARALAAAVARALGHPQP